MVCHFLCEGGLRYNDNADDPGAQTERPGVAGPVRVLLGGGDAPAAFLPLLCLSSVIPPFSSGTMSPCPLVFCQGASLMPLTIEAIYENGVLKPNQPLPLPEHAKVQVTVHVPGAVQQALAAVQRLWVATLDGRCRNFAARGRG